ncbi:MAG: acyl-CoA dehydrogenase family protein [Cyanobacteria bacterium J06642_11]
MSASVLSAPLVLLSQVLTDHIAPQATAIDQDPKVLQTAFQRLGQHNFLGLKAPKTWGGRGWSAAERYRFVEQVTRHSGALAFLHAQHERCIHELVTSDNTDLQTQYLTAAINGTVGLGVGFSHLRRPQQPITATEQSGGYVFNGTVPWITGFGIFDHWMLAAQLPDGRAAVVLAPFQAIDNAITFSAPMGLAALESTQTVTATLNNWYASPELVLDIKPAGWIQECDRTYPLTHNFFALGCAQAGLDILQKSPTGANAYNQLQREVDQCRTDTYDTLETPSPERIRLRAWAIELAVRCAHAAVIVSRGAANLAHHPAQRVYREALAFSVSGQSTPVMDASLEHILHR